MSICDECTEIFDVDKEGICLCGRCNDKRIESEDLDRKSEEFYEQ